MERLENAARLRAETERHYNCAQSLLVAFAGAMGLTPEQAFSLGANFGSGMRHGSTCGAVTAALMILGAAGYDETEAAQLLGRFREENGALDCRTLLACAKDAQIPRKEHCDRLVLQTAAYLEGRVAP